MMNTDLTDMNLPFSAEDFALIDLHDAPSSDWDTLDEELSCLCFGYGEF